MSGIASTRPVARRANALRCSYRVAAIAIALLLYACGDDSPHEPALPAPAQLAIGASFDNAAGGIREAYDRTDRLAVTIFDSAEVRFEQDLPFDPSAVQTRVQLAVPLRATTETFELELELRRGADAVFSGSAEATLSAGATFPVEIALQPVLTGVACAGEDIVFDAYGETMQVGAAALFVTGDTIPDRAIEWSSQDTAVATVQPNGSVTAVGDGETEIECAAGSFTDSRTVRVLAEVASVEVSPSRATINPGATQQFGAILRDRRDNVIGGRTVAWTSTDEAVATVTSEGIATALAPGTARIDATSDDVTGNATLVVTQPPDAVTGEASTGQRSAALTGSVNPNGLATDYWFEWGTDPELETSTSTPEAEAGAGREPVDVGSEIGELEPGTDYYFRVVARSEAGTMLGEVASFRTAPAPLTVATAAASDVGSSSAVVNGTVNPNGESTVAWFEWSRIPSLEEFDATPRREVGSGSTTQPISAPLAELLPNVTYYFRAAASNDAGTARGEILSFTPSLPPAAVTGEASPVQDGAVLSGTVNPNGLATDYWFEWGTDPELETSTSTPEVEAGAGREPVDVGRDVGGLEPGTDYYFRVVARSEAGTTLGEVVSFRTVAAPPTVATAAASDVGSASAVVNGTVNPNGTSTVAWFEWSRIPSLDEFDATPRQEVGSGSTTQRISASLAELVPNVTYYFRAAARNDAGTVRDDNILSFTPSLPPAAVTGEVSAGQRSAALTGTVNPNGLATDYWFEWGTDPELDQTTSTPVEGAGAGREPVEVARDVGGLEPGTDYYFRLVARSEAGTATGEIESFRTAPAPPTVATAPASNVGPFDADVNGTVNPNGASTVAWFEWSDVSPRLEQFSTTPRQEVGSGSTAQRISESLLDLLSNVTHYFRAAASSQAGTVRGEILRFTPSLPPDAVTGEAAPVGAFSASLTGTVDPNGLATDYWFEWGTDPELETFTSTPESRIDAGRAPVDVVWHQDGLTPFTTYYFRVAARSQAGTTMGEIVSFTTSIIVDSVGPRNVPSIR